MPLHTKLVLSAKELALIQNADWFLTKKEVTEKVYGLLSAMIPVIEQQVLIEGNPVHQFKTQPPKISKGENYKGLPYVTLDYPRWFPGEDIFAVRTMFWWGHFFSITLHLAGNYRAALAGKLKAIQLAWPELYICIHEEQWHHHFEADNYVPITTLSAQALELAEHKKFVKLALKFDLSHLEQMHKNLLEGYKKIGKILS